MGGTARSEAGQSLHSANPFGVLDNEQHLDRLYPPIAPKGGGPLVELSADNCHNQLLAATPDAHTLANIRRQLRSSVGGALVAKNLPGNLPSKSPRRRKPVEASTFEPPVSPYKCVPSTSNHRQLLSQREPQQPEVSTESTSQSLGSYHLLHSADGSVTYSTCQVSAYEVIP
jgi:hypothetical protein